MADDPSQLERVQRHHTEIDLAVRRLLEGLADSLNHPHGDPLEREPLARMLGSMSTAYEEFKRDRERLRQVAAAAHKAQAWDQFLEAFHSWDQDYPGDGNAPRFVGVCRELVVEYLGVMSRDPKGGDDAGS